jgi:uncharacterized repeat protein (TIGR03803 family)
MRQNSYRRWSLLGVFLSLLLAFTTSRARSQALTSLYDFNLLPNGLNVCALTQGPDGTLYGLTSRGGISDAGVVFSVSPSGANYKILYYLPAGSKGASLVYGPDGALYGASRSGFGKHELGCIFSISTTGTNLKEIHAFTDPTVTAYPVEIVIGPDQVIYGIAGAISSAVQTVFRMALDGTGFAILGTFSDFQTGYDANSLIMGADGNLYGTCWDGIENYRAGSIWTCSTKGGITALDATGNNPNGVIQGPDGYLYVTTANGHTNNYGALSKVATSGAPAATYPMTKATGSTPSGALTVTASGIVYGLTQSGGANGEGTLFALDTSTGTLTDVYDLPVSLGNGSASSTMITGLDGSVYTAQNGAGFASCGEIFAYKPGGSVSSVYQFTADFGAAQPTGLMQASDGTLYSLTFQGGDYGDGVLFAVKPDGTGQRTIGSYGQRPRTIIPQQMVAGKDGQFYSWTGTDYNYEIDRIDTSSGALTPIHIFTSDESAVPTGLIYGADGRLYGVAKGYLTTDPGVIFRLNTDGTGYTVLHTFGSSGDGIDPNYVVQGSDGKLYGTTPAGGDSALDGDGIVFSYDPVTATYTRLANLGGTLGSQPTTILLASDGNLYGTTSQGGVVFRLPAGGGTPTIVATLPAANGQPFSLIDAGGGILYGLQGAADGSGSLFGLNVAGASAILTTYTTFGASSMATSGIGTPYCLILGKDRALYAVAPGAGAYGYGEIYRYVPAAATVTGLTLNPTSVLGGATVSGTVTISLAAPSNGVTVSLTSNTSAAKTPSSVTVSAGQTTASFTVQTSATITATTSATITASYEKSSATAKLTVQPVTITGISLSPSTVTGGVNSSATVTISAPAPTGGAVVHIKSSSAAANPDNVTIPAGSTSGTATLPTVPVTSNTTATITATYLGSSQNATLTIQKDAVKSIVLSPTTVTGGGSSTATVTLAGPAPTGGLAITMSSSSKVATVGSLTVAAGKTSGTVTVTTTAVASAVTATITAAYSGSSATAGLTVTAPVVTSLALSPTSLTGGDSSTATVTLSGPAPTGGATIKFSSDNTSASAAAVVVPAGKTSATATVKTVAVASTVTATITAGYAGSSQSATLKILPPTVTAASLNPASVVGGGTSQITVTLSSPAPKSGATIALTSSSKAAAPANLVIAAGQTSGTAAVKTTPVTSATSATLKASFAGTSATATLTVNPPTLASLTLNPSTVQGGKPVTATVTLNGPTAAATTITLASANTSATVPTSVSIKKGASSATFTVKTSTPTAGSVKGDITATLGSTSVSATLTVTQ